MSFYKKVKLKTNSLLSAITCKLGNSSDKSCYTNLLLSNYTPNAYLFIIGN